MEAGGLHPREPQTCGGARSVPSGAQTPIGRDKEEVDGLPGHT